MADQITNYTCLACGGPLHFSNESQDLTCDYCDSHFSVAEVEAYYAKQNEAHANAQSQWAQEDPAQWGVNGEIRLYNCSACGAQLICDLTTAATSCPYCGNPSVVPGQLEGMLRPDLVIPFQLDKNAAVAALRKHYHKKKLLPRAFAAENHIEEIKGVYVPFWLFDGDMEADAYYKGTRSHTRTTHNERIITTEHYILHRAGSVRFEKIPADASRKMPDAHMDAIEPFDYSQLKPFAMAYLAGYMADKYDVSMEECAQRADKRAAQTVNDALRASCVGYESVTETTCTANPRRNRAYYALFPVWMLNTNWKGKNFLFAMNGQTGKLIGDLPVDKGRYWGYFFATAAIVTAVVTAILTFLL